MQDLFTSLLSVDGGKFIATIGIIMWIDIRGTVKSMARSLESLNSRVGIVVERVDSHEKRIDKLEDR